MMPVLPVIVVVIPIVVVTVLIGLGVCLARTKAEQQGDAKNDCKNKTFNNVRWLSHKTYSLCNYLRSGKAQMACPHTPYSATAVPTCPPRINGECCGHSVSR